MAGHAETLGFFTERNMSTGRPVALGPGRAVVYSARCPGMDGPNQDAAAVIPVNGTRAVLVVADGMGGRPGGAEAARIAISALRQAVTAAGDDQRTLRVAILDAVEHANRQVIELGGGAATTLAVAEIEGESLRPYHVGDSAVLVVGQRGKLKLHTVAHSPVGYAVEAGLLDEGDAMHHAERHVVSNMVGNADMRIEVGSPLRLAKHDTVLIASDGLLDNMSRDEILAVIRRGKIEHGCASLAATAEARMREPRQGQPSKPDDLTFILFRR